jgi:protein TonB
MKADSGRGTLLVWGLSLLIHGVLIGALLWWLEVKLNPTQPVAQPVPMQLSMLAAPVTPAVQEQPVEPVVEPPAEPVVEPEVPPRVDEPAPLPKPVPQPKPIPPKPKASPPKPKPEQTQAKPAPVQPPVQIEPAVAVVAPAPSEPAAVPVSLVPAPMQPARAPENADAEAAYKTRIRQAVNEHKHYPNLARRLHEEGRVVVAFTLDRSGALLAVSIKQSSGSERLDEAAMQAVRDAAPFPPFPEGSPRQHWDFSLPLRFALDS